MAITSKILIWIVWIAIISLSAYFFLDNVVAYFYGYRSRVFGNSFFHNQIWVALHMAGGTLILLLGPFQFWKWFRNKFVKGHRVMGKVYLLGAGLAGFSALRISLISSCAPCRISLFLLSIFMLLSSAFAWIAIRQRNIKAHRQFMVRSYICALAFVTVRIDGILPLDFLFSDIADATFRRTVNEYFFSFVPLIIGEIIMTWIPAIKRKKQKVLRLS